MKALRAILFSFMLVAALHADDETQKLIDDARTILIAHRETPATPQEYARCIFSLEKAQALVEGNGDMSSARAQEVNSLLFWAKRFSNLEISNELQKLRTASGEKPVPVRVATVKSAEKSALPEAKQLTDAKSAYDAAAAFARSNAKDPYTVSLRWFQMASQHAGTDYALKALSNARDAQALVASSDPSKAASIFSKRTLAETEELKQDKSEFVLVRDAMASLKSNDVEDAIAKYKLSIATHETVQAQRGLGHAYIRLAQQIAEQLTPKYADMEKEYNAAFNGAYELRGGNRFFNDRNARWVTAQQKLAALRKESDKIILNSADAQSCFEKVLKLEPDNKDFDAAAYIGVSMARRPASRFRGRGVLKDFLDRYKPGGPEEQLTYEFCKSEYERLGR